MKKLLFFALFAGIAPCQFFGAQQELKKEVAEHVIAPGGPGSFVLGIPGLTTPINPKPDMKAIEQAKQNRAKLGAKAAELDKQLRALFQREYNEKQDLKGDFFEKLVPLLQQGADPQTKWGFSVEPAILDNLVKLGEYGSLNNFAKLLNILAEYGFNFDKSFADLVGILSLDNQNNDLNKREGFNSFSLLLPLLLAFVSDPNIPASDSASTALHQIALYPRAQELGLIKLLLDHDAEINAQNINGETPLMTSITSNTLSNSRVLMHYNANPLLVTKNNQTVLQILDDTIIRVADISRFGQAAKSLREFRPELEKYTKEYRQKHTKKVAETIPELNPNLIDMIINSLVGEKTPQEKALQ